MDHIKFQDEQNQYKGTSLKMLNMDEQSPQRHLSMADVKRKESKTVGVKFESKRKLEDSCMKRLMTLLYGFQEESFAKETITQKRVSLNKEYVKFVDSLLGLLVFVNISLASVENEIFYNNNNVSTLQVDMLRMTIFFISLALAILVFVNYKLRLQIEKMLMRRLQDDGLVQSRLIYTMTLEMLICLVHCPMSVDGQVTDKLFKGTYTYSFDAIIFVFQLVKPYLFLRLWLHYSMWTNKSAQKTLMRFRVRPTLTFALKAELKYRPLRLITTILFGTIFLLGIAVRNFERSYEPINVSNYASLTQDIFNAWWLMIITMTTVGFGDYFPWTHLGRSICIIACIIGQLLLSLLVVALANSAEFNPEESKAYHNLKEKEVSSRKARLNIEPNETELRTAKLDNLPLDEMLKNLYVVISAGIEDIKVEVDKLHELEIRLETFQIEQKQTSRNMDELLKIQANMSKTL